MVNKPPPPAIASTHPAMNATANKIEATSIVKNSMLHVFYGFNMEKSGLDGYIYCVDWTVSIS